MGWDGKNRRSFPRVFFPCLIKIHGAKPSDDAILTHTETLSIGGVRVILKNSLILNSLVNIQVDLMDAGEHLSCQGKVVWSDQRKEAESLKPLFFDIGIEFVNIPDVDRQRLQTVVSHHLKKDISGPLQ